MAENNSFVDVSTISTDLYYPQLNASFDFPQIRSTNVAYALDTNDTYFGYYGNITNLTGFTNGNIYQTTSSSEDYPAGLPSGYTWSHIIVTSIYVTVIIVAIVLGNALVCIAIATDRNLKSTQNWFIASLAVADLLLGLLIVPFSLANELMGYWYFGTVWCELWKAIDVLLCTASINSLCLISLDRYWSITRAIHYARQRTPKRATIMIATVWIISAVVCVPPLIGWKQPPRQWEYPVCELSEDIGYVFYSSMGSFYIPMVIILFVYARIYFAARDRARRAVKKPKVKCNENGKSSSTTTTTTSFTVLPKSDIRAGMEHDVSTIPEAEGSSALSDGDESYYTTYNPKSGAFERCGNGKPSTGTALPSGDERRNLLSNDTDSMDTSNRGMQVTSDSESTDIRHISLKHIPLIVDTDSSTHETPNVKRKRTTHETCEGEHSKPLLEESDSAPHRDVPEHSSKDDGEVDKPTSFSGSTSDFNNRHMKLNPSGKDVPVTSKQQTLSMASIKGFNFLHKSQDRGKTKPKKEQVFRTAAQRDHERQKRKLAKARERRATIVVGIVMAAFVLSWLPFFSLYVSSALCSYPCIPMFVFKFFFWLGYCNSALNPFIYTIFNREFRHAFQRIIFRRTRH